LLCRGENFLRDLSHSYVALLVVIMSACDVIWITTH
jgi:hypothetical protein